MMHTGVNERDEFIASQVSRLPSVPFIFYYTFQKRQLTSLQAQVTLFGIGL